MRAPHSIKLFDTVRPVKGEQLKDAVAIEEPMEVRLRHWVDGRPEERSISITMRTPGSDAELAIGFLFTEGIIHSSDDVVSVEHCGPPNVDGLRNVVKVTLSESTQVDVGKLMRNFYTTSSCGVCGKSSLDALAVEATYEIVDQSGFIGAPALQQAPAKLRSKQRLFDETGGIHAAGLLNPNGDLSVVREDVGRHNALDKLIGHAFANKQLPLSQAAVILSGRASFELLQKCMMAGIPVVAAVGAPSSLAIECAIANNMTLIGFLNEDSFNVYSGAQRIVTTV